MDNFPPSKAQFETALAKALKGCEFKPDMIGLSNTFEQSTFQCEADYYRYIRERVFRDLCANAAQAEVKSFKKNLTIKACLFCIAFCILTAGILIPNATASAREASYSSGYDAGKATGLAVGKEDGYASGFSVGQEYGYEAGKEFGYESGFENGRYEGYDEGYGDAEVDYITTDYSFGLPIPYGEDGSSWRIFYATPWGEHFHREDCGYVTTPMPIRYANAVEAGFAPCEHCQPLYNGLILP